MRPFLLVLLLAAAAGAGVLAWRLVLAPSHDPLAAAAPVKLGDRRPDFTLPDLQGVPHRVSEWDGKVLVVNFWATWCPPCRAEIPTFIDLQKRYGDRGLQLLGVAVDDPARVAQFVKAEGVNYPVLVGDSETADVSTRYGNRLGALPFTVIVDRSGRLSFFKRGELHADRAEAIIQGLL